MIANIPAGTYTLTVTDNNANTAVNSVVVTEPAPLSNTIIVDSLVSCQNSNNGGLTSFVSGGTAPYNFVWSNASTLGSPNNLSAGTYTVTITDANGCTLVDSAVIASADTIAPVAISQNATIYLDANGVALLNVAQIDNGSFDNCTIASRTLSTTSFNCSDLGANTVELYVIDTDGNRDTANAAVTVLDTLGPNVITQTYTTTLDSSGKASFTASDIDNGTFDNCQLDSIWVDSITFNCSNAGNNMVWLYAVDMDGNRDSATATVVVIDNLPKDSVIFNEQACGSYTWSRTGLTYSSTGLYRDTLLNPIGCDSIYYFLFLTIDTVQNVIDTVIACDNYTWRDTVTYTASNGTATFTILNANGCDSITYNLNLTINQSDSLVVQQAAACGSYTWNQNNQTYTSSGIYTDVLTNAAGCDSTITLDLEIRPLSLNVVNMSDSLFAFEDHPQATYQWYDCRGDSIIPGATSRGYRPDTTGFFKVIISNGLCSDTSDCEEVINVGIVEASKQEARLNIYPNPTNQDFFIETNRVGENDQLMVLDMNGKIILQQSVQQYQIKIETSGWNAGIYFVRYQDQIKKLVLTR